MSWGRSSIPPESATRYEPDPPLRRGTLIGLAHVIIDALNGILV